MDNWEKETLLFREEIQNLFEEKKKAFELFWNNEENLPTRIAIFLTSIEHLPDISKIRTLFSISCPEIVEFAKVMSLPDENENDNKIKMEKYDIWEKSITKLIYDSLQSKENECQKFVNVKKEIQELFKKEGNLKNVTIAIESINKARSFILLSFIHSIVSLVFGQIDD